jgi:hypothetical protein
VQIPCQNSGKARTRAADQHFVSAFSLFEIFMTRLPTNQLTRHRRPSNSAQ